MALRRAAVAALVAAALVPIGFAARAEPASFAGQYYRGSGDVEYLRLLEMSRRMFAPDPAIQSLPMLYSPLWNGFVEGPTWGAWWVQNSYGTTYCALPFYDAPYDRFLQNAQDLWFSQMGDGKRAGYKGWVAPDGCLCDCASPGSIIYRQGDGRVDMHDWGMEFTAAGLLMQCELLLISRDPEAIAHYLPKLERCAAFLDTRRDTRCNLYLAGPAGNLLAPSFAGWKKPDGTYGKAYHAGLTVTTIAALDRLAEVEELAGAAARASRYRTIARMARKGLAALTRPEGYLAASMDPDGVLHGVVGAARHGYFEASANHDAVAFRVAGDDQARRIYRQIAAIPGLRPYAFILPNYPSYDDMYEKPEGLWGYGTWVNGGHWSTCEARAIMMYSRLGRHEDIRRSLTHLRGFAERFRMDNPLTQCGSDVYQPNEPINLCYDTLGPAAGAIRGLFEYLYTARALRLIPHVPPTVTRLEQRFPIRYGSRRLYLATAGKGPVTAVTVNGRRWALHDAVAITLPYAAVPDRALVSIGLGGAAPPAMAMPADAVCRPLPAAATDAPPSLRDLAARSERARALHHVLEAAGRGRSQEAAHARLIVEWCAAACQRARLAAAGKLAPLPPASQRAADQSYIDAGTRLIDGLDRVIAPWVASGDTVRRSAAAAWRQR